MADESSNEKKPEDTEPKDGISDIPDIDALLLQASESLAEVESELGTDDTASGITAAPPSGKQIDEAMATVEEQAQAISEQVATETADEQPSDVGEVDDVLTDLASELDELAAQDSTDTAADESPTKADDIDEILSDLVGEVEELEATQEDASTDEAPEAQGSGEAEESAESESVVETDEVDSGPDEEQKQTPEDSVDENAEADDSVEAETTEEVDAGPDEEVDGVEDVIDQLGDVAEEADEEEPVDDVEDDVLMEELAEKEAGPAAVVEPAEAAEEKPKKSKHFDELPRASRIVAQGLTVVNKPFITIDQSTKDLLGIVGVLTAIVTVLTVGLFLLIK